MSISKKCDYCDVLVESFHDFGGNIQVFGSVKACDGCWERLDSKRDELEKKSELYREKLIASVKKELRND